MNLAELPNSAFSTAQIAKMLGVSVPAVHARAKRNKWELAPEKKQGGGFLWHFSSMDEETKEKVSNFLIREDRKKNGPALAFEAIPVQELEELWDEFNKKSSKTKEKAFLRQEILQDVLNLYESGVTLTQAFVAVGQMRGVAVGTLRNWYFGTASKRGVRGIDPKDWAPILANQYKGRVTRAHCDPIAWEFLKKDYLRTEAPSFLSCFRRLEDAAEVHGWAIPSDRTLSRRLFEELLPAVIQYMRTGKIVNDYPDQVRRRDTFAAGEAVSGDALSFDKIYVYDAKTGEVYNMRVWFFEDVRSGKILAWAGDKSENSDMFRLATYNLVGETVPRYMYIDNTRAAANKILTGQMPGRHRFTNKATDPVGLLKHFGIEVCFTNPDHEISSPGSKPIERAFGIGGLHSMMRDLPVLAGRGYSKNPIPDTEFLELLPQVVAAYNAREGRTGGICNGRSFDQVYAEGLQQTTVRKASPKLRNMLLLSQESVKVNRQGVVSIKAGRGESKHRYYAEELAHMAGEHVAVLFNPESLSDDVEIYTLDGKHVCTARWLKTVAFNDRKAGREHAKHKARRAKHIKQAANEAALISDLEFQQLGVNKPVSENPVPAKTLTMLSEKEVSEKIEQTVSPERQRQLREILQKNIMAEDNDVFPFAAQG